MYPEPIKIPRHRTHIVRLTRNLRFYEALDIIENSARVLVRIDDGIITLGAELQPESSQFLFVSLFKLVCLNLVVHKSATASMQSESLGGQLFDNIGDINQ